MRSNNRNISGNRRCIIERAVLFYFQELSVFPLTRSSLRVFSYVLTRNLMSRDREQIRRHAESVRPLESNSK
jgi:hypothetical protein